MGRRETSDPFIFMNVHIHKRFIDARGHLLAPGPQDLPDDLARRIIADGKGVEVSEAGVIEEAPVVEEKPIEELFKEVQASQPAISIEESAGELIGVEVTDGGIVPNPNLVPDEIKPLDGLKFTELPKSPIQVLAESDIPVDFPEREKLIIAGISTVASLKEANVKERLEDILGFGPATVTKIGLAIADLP